VDGPSPGPAVAAAATTTEKATGAAAATTEEGAGAARETEDGQPGTARAAIMVDTGQETATGDSQGEAAAGRDRAAEGTGGPKS
jgi:hypothetical protein